MALTKGTNSYVTVEEADAYFEDRLDAAAWADEEDEGRKSKALVTATSLLDALCWTGYAVSESQALAFPRVGCYFDPRLGYDIAFSSTVPDRIVKANYELAYHLLNNDGLLDDTGSVQDLGLGTVKLDRISSPDRIPFVVKRLIQPMLQSGGSNSWWRNN